MTIPIPPIYYSYRDFLNNYRKDYEQFKKIYPSAPMSEFLYKVRDYSFLRFRLGDLYKNNEMPFINCIKMKINGEYTFDDLEDVDIGSVSELTILYCSRFAQAWLITSEEAFDYLTKEGDENDLLLSVPIGDNPHLAESSSIFFVNKRELKLYKPFLCFNKENMHFDFEKWEDFQITIRRITKFVENYDDELEPEIIESGEDNQENAVLDFTKNKKQRIGLLIHTGIIDFLREKYKANNNEIAKFIEEITKEPLSAGSVNPSISEENKNYPIKNSHDKVDYDLLINTFFKKSLQL